MGMYNATTKRGYKLTISASASCSLADKEFTLFSKSKRTIMVIGGVPIYIKTTFSVEGEFGAYTTGSLTLSHEFDKTTSLTAGIEYKNGKWSYPYSKSSTTTVDNNLSANAALIQNFKVGPKLEFSIYGTVSPYIQAMLTEDLTLFAGLYNTDPYWTAQVDIGGEITAGVAAEILGYDLFDLNHTWSSSFYKLVLPNKIKMISGNNQSFLLGDPLNNNPKIRVVSSEGFGVPGVAVFFTPLDGGSVTDNKVFTNIHGEAYTKWTPGSTFSRLEANAYGNFFGWRYKMNNSPVTFIANGNYNCSTSSLAANIIENNGVVSPKGINGSPPYQYSTDAISYSSVAPSITTNYGQSYTFYVKDDNNCIVSKAYSSPPDPCLNSTLVVNAFAVGNAIQLKASNGSEPYQFSVDNVNYSSDTIYTNMNIGQFYAFVIDDLGCKDSTTVDIKTNQPAINANFSADSLIFEVGDTVQFLNQSNNAYSFQWDFGDGNSSTLENPKHAYNSSGYKDISLNVSNVYGSDNHNMNNYIDVGYAPSPDFSCQSSAVLNHPVTFTDISTNNPSSWLWIIGTDTLTQQNPVYYFTNSGYHSVKLIACNKYGKSSITKTNIIEILDAPVADFYCSDSTGGIGSGGDQITFYDNSNGIVNSWLWDFGDGNNSTIQNPDYLYSSTGLYDVKLIISDGYNVDSITKINLIDIGIPPIANYNASSDTTIIGNSIQFTNQSVNAVSYFWDFGDGITSTLQNPTHSYNLVGNYTVKLLAANNYGTDSIVHSNIINVGDIPSATFNYYDSTKAIGDTINFNNNTLEIANQPNTYKWYFGDGDSSIIENPKHAYNANGFYDITLIASNIYGLDTIHRPNYIEIGDKPVVGFIASEDTIAVGDTVFFSDTSTNNPNQWLWLFDGSWNNATTTANTYFVFDTAGIYNVKLGCRIYSID
jgi:PKD repeat protein